MCKVRPHGTASKDLGEHEGESRQTYVITYSTMLKGRCQNGSIQAGFAILEQMKKDAWLKPDEIMHNNLVDEGLRLLEEMQSDGVPPSNFTLSILAKLMNLARRLDRAFALVDDVTKKYISSPTYTSTLIGASSSLASGLGCGLSPFTLIMVQDRPLPLGWDLACHLTRGMVLCRPGTRRS